MKIVKRDCGCIYIADDDCKEGILVYFCGYDRDEEPYRIERIAELPRKSGTKEGPAAYTVLPDQEHTLLELESLICDGIKYRKIRRLITGREK